VVHEVRDAGIHRRVPPGLVGRIVADIGVRVAEGASAGEPGSPGTKLSGSQSFL
jgi:hypothetical protein